MTTNPLNRRKSAAARKTGPAGEPARASQSASRLSRPAARLLAALAAGGSARLTNAGGRDVVVASTTGCGRGDRVLAGTGAAETLVGHGLAEWQGGGESRLLVASEAGRARVRRDSLARAGGPDLAFMGQHLDVGELDLGGSDGIVMADLGESPLAWLRRRKGPDGAPLIDAACFAAGERLRADLTRAAMLPRVTADWSRSPSGSGRGPAEATDAMLAARQRVRTALSAIGTDLAGILLDVCGFLKGMEQVEAERGWPARSAKVVLVLALGRLAEHYGYEREAKGPGRSLGIRTWQAPIEEPAGS